VHTRIEVFYAYAPEDEVWVKELEKHLSSLQRLGLISTWHPRLIVAGEDWQHVIDIHFQRASLILLLISPDFLSSDYCYGKEMEQALKREREKGVCVIPILLRPVDWRHAPFAHLRPLPPDATFLTEWANIDRAFAEVTDGIRHAIENLSSLAASLTRTDYPSIWNVPFPRNLFQEHALGSQHVDFARTLSGQGELYRAQGKYAQAEQFYQRALAIREQVLGPSHPDVARSLDSLAVLYYAQGKYQQAELLFQRALAAREQAQ
jgi:hypothetical protein